MNPEYDAEELTRSLRWAQASAATDPEPNFGVAVLPRYAKAGHTGLLSRPGTHVLCTLPKKFRFAPQDAWAGGPDGSTGTKFEVDLVAVYNEAGRTEFGRDLGPDSPLATLLRDDYGLRTGFTPPPAVPAASEGLAGRGMGRPVRRWPPGFSQAPRELPLGAPETPARAPPPPCAPPPALLRWADPSCTYAYTDGSHTPGSGRAGAGVWLPDGLPDGSCPAAPPGDRRAPTCVAGGDDAPKDLLGLGGAWAEYTFVGVQTSIRAELIAIRQAVLLCDGGSELVVFTDCLSAMNMLRRWWYSPNTMLLHHERPLIESTARAIRDRCGPVRLVKVRSHVGIPGNEIADAVAALAATGGGASHLRGR